jgi:hypothetical protein
VYVSVNIWRTIHPLTTVVPTLGEKMGPRALAAFWFSALSFMLLFALLLTMRVHLEERRAELDRLYLAEEE